MTPLTLVFMTVVFFTSAGPAQVTKQFDGTLEECRVAASYAGTMADKQLPGPDGEPAMILDAQAQCTQFVQGRTASK